MSARKQLHVQSQLLAIVAYLKGTGSPIVLRTVKLGEVFPVFEADSPQVKLIRKPAVGCHYFLPGLQLPSQLQSITAV